MGRALLARLGRDAHEVVALVRRPGDSPRAVRTEVADVLDATALRRAVARVEPEGVCHLAALTRVRESFAEPSRHFAVNVGGTVALLEALRVCGAAAPRLVFASTAAVYGPGAPQPISEGARTAPASPYAASKWAAEELLRYEARTGALGAVTLRCFNAAGPGDTDPTRLIPRALSAAAGEAPSLGVNGDGSAVRDYVHVDDLAAAYALALSAARPGEHRVYNVGGAAASVREVVAAVEEVSGRPVPVERRAPQDEPAELRADSSRLREELGWAPERSDLLTIVDDAWRARWGVARRRP